MVTNLYFVDSMESLGQLKFDMNRRVEMFRVEWKLGIICQSEGRMMWVNVWGKGHYIGLKWLVKFVLSACLRVRVWSRPVLGGLDWRQRAATLSGTRRLARSCEVSLRTNQSLLADHTLAHCCPITIVAFEVSERILNGLDQDTESYWSLVPISGNFLADLEKISPKSSSRESVVDP